MIIATRILRLKHKSVELDVPINIEMPVSGDRCWDCYFEIVWPDTPIRNKVSGLDAAQALYLAMQRIALELYMSPQHHAGDLRWGKPGEGYGFPMAKSGYEDLVGFDRESQVP